MQLLIDTDTTPKSQLHAIIALLTSLLGLSDEPAQDTAAELPPAGTFGPAPPAFAPKHISLIHTSPDPLCGVDSPFVVPMQSTPIVSETLSPVDRMALAVAPLAPVVTAVASATELDAAGLPWDARIHAESKAKVADNTWRKKRNLAPGFYDSIVAELRGAYPLPAALTHTPNIAPPPPPVQQQLVAPPPPPAPVTPQPTPVPVDASNTGVAQLVPAQQGQKPLEFKNVAFKAANLVNAGKMSNAQIPAAVARATQGQLANMGQLLTDPRGPIYLQAFSDELDKIAASAI